jgi:hypothetical protein
LLQTADSDSKCNRGTSSRARQSVRCGWLKTEQYRAMHARQAAICPVQLVGCCPKCINVTFEAMVDLASYVLSCHHLFLHAHANLCDRNRRSLHYHSSTITTTRLTTNQPKISHLLCLQFFCNSLHIFPFNPIREIPVAKYVQFWVCDPCVLH